MKRALYLVYAGITLLICTVVFVRQCAMYCFTWVDAPISSETLGGIRSPDQRYNLRFETFTVPEYDDLGTAVCFTRGYLSKVVLAPNGGIVVSPSTSRTIYWNTYPMPDDPGKDPFLPSPICRSYDFQSYWIDAETLSIDGRVISTRTVGYDYRFDLSRLNSASPYSRVRG